MSSISAPNLISGRPSTLARRCFSQNALAGEQTDAAEMAPPLAQRLELVREHGDFSLAYNTAAQPGLQYFGNNRGYIAYDSRWSYTFVLGDPVAAARDRESLLRQFVARHRRVAFCQISPTTAQIVGRLGYYVNEMGVDSIISLADYNFKGQEKQWLRTADSWTSRRGYTTREETTTQRVGVPEINAVSQAWRETRTVKRKEVRFLNRPLEPSVVEPGTRRFFFFGPDQRLLAFVLFDPMYRDGQQLGYVACNKRRHPDAPAYAEQAIMKHAIEVFQREGCQEFRLGLSPLAWIEDREFRASWILRMLFRFAFSSRVLNRHFYNVQGHAEYKRRYRGREEKVYFATRSYFNPVQLAALMKTCKLT
jgi:phosphatidylglycerol lysyltransferase